MFIYCLSETGGRQAPPEFFMTKTTLHLLLIQFYLYNTWPQCALYVNNNTNVLKWAFVVTQTKTRTSGCFPSDCKTCEKSTSAFITLKVFVMNYSCSVPWVHGFLIEIPQRPLQEAATVTGNNPTRSHRDITVDGTSVYRCYSELANSESNHITHHFVLFSE